MKYIFNLILICAGLYLLNAQFTPAYSTTQNIYTGAAQGSISALPAATIVVTFAPAGFTISTQISRKPFVGVCSLQKFAIHNQQGFYFWTKVLSFTATSFTIEMQAPTPSQGFGANFQVKFRYIIVSSIFPSLYMSRQIYISGSPSLPTTIGINGFYYQNFTMSTLAPSTYTDIPLGNDTVILHSLSDITLNQTGSSDSLFEIKCNFSIPVSGGNQFTLRMTTKYGVTITKFGLLIFLFNKNNLETTMGLRIQFGPILFTNLMSGSGSFLIEYTSTTAWQDFFMFYYGFSGFELSNEENLGFQLTLTNLSPTTPNYSFRLNNLITGSNVPLVYTYFALVTELKCPVQGGWTSYYLSDTDGKCYSICPFTEFTLPPQIGLTGIYQCKSCIATCQTCSGLNSFCTSCFSIQNRVLSNNNCIPGVGYYENGMPVAPPCLSPCLSCSNFSINCTSCYINAFLTLSGGIITCLNCNFYDTMCLTCSPLKCLTCSPGYIVDVNGGCTTCTDYHPMCNMCNASVCTACNTGHYLNGVNCSACTNFHSKCNQCTPSACLSCDFGWMVNFIGVCVACTDYHPQCLSCNPTKCTTCSIGYFPNGFTCSPCANFGPQCTQCTRLACTNCLSPSILSVSGNCITCTTYHPQCSSCNPSSCTACNIGFYLIASTCMPCTNFSPQCTDCTASSCTMCNAGFMMSAIGNCITCGHYHAQCTACTLSECSTCAVGFYANGLTCAPCANYHHQCQQCSSSACTLCNSAFHITPTGSCVSCADFHPNCLTCTGTTCTQCTTDHALNNTGCRACSSISLECNQCSATGICLSCNSGFILASNVCLTCMSLYSSKCQTCNSTQCTSCISGYLLTGLQCIYSAGVCGDGQWNQLTEQCDDGNFDPNDGCDPNCKAEEGFVCLYREKQLSGASFCKYNNPITVEFSSLLKQPSANILHVFFTVNPSQLKDWNSSAIKSLMTPFQIVNNQSSTPIIIQYSSLQFKFYRQKTTEHVEVTLTYDQLIQGGFLKYNIIPINTGIPYISHLTPKYDIYTKLNSGKAGIGFYNYNQEIYQFEESVNVFSTVIGMIALALLFIGLCFPAGKLIIVEGLAVLQVSYFSLLMFNKIPPSYLGFKNLVFTNGYNDPNICSSDDSADDMSIYDILGLSKTILSNYNFSFIIFFIAPFLIGVTGFIVAKKMNQKESKQIDMEEKNTFLPKEDLNENKNQKAIKENITINIFKRIMYENSFYGLMATGYLAWCSVFYGLKNGLDGLNAFGAFLIISAWLGYVVLFCLVDSSPIKVSQQQNKEITILKGFGEFRDVFHQVSKAKSTQKPASQRVYVVMMAERVLISAIIVLASSILPMPNLFIAAVNLIMIIGLLIMHKKTQEGLAENEKRGILSHIYQNYTLRQVINLQMNMTVQLLLFYSQMAMDGIKTTSDLASAAMFLGITTPTIYSALLMVSLVTTIFFWVWQVVNDNFFEKGNRLFRKLFSIPEEEEMDSLTKQIVQNVKQTVSQPKESERSMNNQTKDEFDNVVEQYISTSPIFQTKNSPFLGAEEKESRKKMIEVLRLQNDKDGVKRQTSGIAQIAEEQMCSNQFDSMNISSL